MGDVADDFCYGGRCAEEYDDAETVLQQRLSDSEDKSSSPKSQDEMSIKELEEMTGECMTGDAHLYL